MPTTPLCHCGCASTITLPSSSDRILRDLRLRRAVDLIDQQAPLVVERFQPRRQHARPFEVGGGQQFDGEIGVVQPAERVQARRERRSR